MPRVLNTGTCIQEDDLFYSAGQHRKKFGEVLDKEKKKKKKERNQKQKQTKQKTHKNKHKRQTYNNNEKWTNNAFWL